MRNSLFLVLGLLFVNLAWAKDPAVIIAKTGSVAPEGTPWAIWIQAVKKRMEKESGGKLQVKPYLGGKLGGEKEMIEELKLGKLQMFGGSMGAIAAQLAPELNVFELPFLFESEQEVDFVMDKMRTQVAQVLEKKGLVFAMWSENGWHGFATKGKCVSSPNDLKGLRIRAQESAVHHETFKAFGATPVELPVPEVLSALQVGIADGFSTTPIFSFATGWYRPITHFTYSKHLYQPGAIVYSKKWFDGLPKDIQKVLLDRTEEQDGLAKVRSLVEPVMGNFKAADITLCPFGASQLTAFKSKAEEVRAQFSKKNKASKSLLDAVVAAKKEYAAKKSTTAKV